jgi:hypothetical protein
MNPFSAAIPKTPGVKCPPAVAARLACGAASIGIALAWPAHASDTCDVLYNAGIKTLQTPHHVYSTKTPVHGVKLPSGVSIFAGGIEYILLDGKWQRSRMTPQDMIENAQEKLKTHPDICTAAGAENINGQAVTTYKVHNNENETDSQVQILISSGLLLGQSVTMPDDSRMDIRYEYTNVQPPAGVK